jgi:16S rRNA (cytosine967-C5)-methyltransferase
VLDVCAAPGGKSFAMAMDRRDRGQILSCDVHPHKLKLIDSGAQRLGITSIRTALADAREEHAAWLQQADVVVADVPCSGLGIIRKKPDIRYKNPRDLAQLPAIQGDILENACRYVRPGGVLVYSTCTVLPEENQEIIHVFLSRHPEFRRETFTLPGPVGLCDGEATLWPQRLGTDGFYICRMRRKA